MSEFFKLPKEMQDVVDYQTKLYTALYAAQVDWLKAVMGAVTPFKAQ